MKVRKIPVRMCIACREMKPKKELIRVVRPPGGAVVIDTGGKASGRGAYLCKKLECISVAKKRRMIEKNLEATDCDTIYLSLSDLILEDVPYDNSIG